MPCPFTHIKPWADRMPEECGVMGAFQPDGESVKDAIYYGLYALQHRGQESAGIAVADGHTVRSYKAMGLVAEVFSGEEAISRIETGHIGIGHVRYSTTGSSEACNCQPLVVKYREGWLALAHNGNLVNAEELRSQLEDDGHITQTALDTEVMAAIIARKGGDLVEAIKHTMATVKGSYALVVMTRDKLIGVRDPLGIRPLALGRMPNGAYVLASESCAFDAIDAELIRDVRPGEIVVIDEHGLQSIRTETPLGSKLCLFEFVYFARPDSTIDGISVYQSRYNAGKYLARHFPAQADMVSGVPDSAITAAIGFSKEAGIPYGESLAKNRYVGRTFIQPRQELREKGVRIKLNALRKNVQGKRLVLVDDSIVRGTTSKKIIDMLRMAGAREVHMRISSPPVVYPCYFGIDTPDSDQLIGAFHSKDEICKLIGADSLEYLSIDDLLKTVEGSSCDFCQGCFNGDYPIPVCQGGRHNGL
ncbi:MAG: amidophosphoribosyltransferase [Eubacteriales bacterium]|nr:amidophosphoribosyltransferase [Eubacteriales bacterium]